MRVSREEERKDWRRTGLDELKLVYTFLSEI